MPEKAEALAMKSQTTLFNESERADYLTTLAHLVGSDGEVTSEEIFALRRLCEELVLGPTSRGQVMAATTGSSDLTEVLERLSATELKYGLLLDLCLTAYWDGTLAEAEIAELHQLGQGLKAEPSQVDACLKLAEKLVKNADTKAELSALAELGIPREALAMACGLEEGRL